MKKKLLSLAGALAPLVLLGHFYAKPLLAQVRAALVQNVDEPGRNPITLFGIGGASNLDINKYEANFTVPAGQRYVIQAFGGQCTVASGDAMTAIHLQLPDSALAVAPAVFLVGDQWSASATTHLYFDPGATVKWQALSNNLDFQSCTFFASGYSITLP